MCSNVNPSFPKSFLKGPGNHSQRSTTCARRGQEGIVGQDPSLPLPAASHVENQTVRWEHFEILLGNTESWVLKVASNAGVDETTPLNIFLKHNAIKAPD